MEHLSAELSQVARDGAGASDSAPEPLIADEAERHDEADPVWRHASFLGDPHHLEPHEVVREGDAPEFLADAGWGSAADRLLAIEHLRLHLVVAELDLPPLVIERRDLLGRVSLGVKERREQDLRREASPLVPDGPCGPAVRRLHYTGTTTAARASEQTAPSTGRRRETPWML